MNNNIIYTSIISLIIFLILIFLSKYKSGLVEQPSNIVRKIHKKNMIKVGGFMYLSIYIVLFENISREILLIIYFAIPFMLLGFLADTIDNFRASSRLILMIITTAIYLLISQNYIVSLDMNILDRFIQNFIFIPYVLTLMSIIFFVIGVNTIDGLHGLKTGIVLIILSNFIYYVDQSKINSFEILYLLITVTIILFIINFVTGIIRSGDTGSYFTGFVLGSLSIKLNSENILNAFHIAIIVGYPVIELVFSYTRRIYTKVSPFKPDSLHLHSLVFKYLYKYVRSFQNKTELCNRMATIVILSFISFFNLIAFVSIRETFVYLSIFIIYILSYLSFYHLVYKKVN